MTSLYTWSVLWHRSNKCYILCSYYIIDDWVTLPCQRRGEGLCGSFNIHFLITLAEAEMVYRRHQRSMGPSENRGYISTFDSIFLRIL